MMYQLRYDADMASGARPCLDDGVVYIDKYDPYWNSTGKVAGIDGNIVTTCWFTGGFTSFGRTSEEVGNLFARVSCPMEVNDV